MQCRNVKALGLALSLAICASSVASAQDTAAWVKTYDLGNVRQPRDGAVNVFDQPGGGHLVAAVHKIVGNRPQSGAADLKFLFLDAVGNQTFIHKASIDPRMFAIFGVAQTVNGGFCVLGWVERLNTLFSAVVMLDSFGQQTSYTYAARNSYWESISETRDGGCIVGGYGIDDDKGATLAPFPPLLGKIAADGSLQWQRFYANEASGSHGSVQQTRDGGYIAAGYSDDTTSVQGLLRKTNAQGVEQWHQVLPQLHSIQSVRQNADFGFALAASDGVLTTSAMVRTDSAGNVLWQFTAPIVGTFSEATYGTELSNGQFALTGYEIHIPYQVHIYARNLDPAGNELQVKVYRPKRINSSVALKETASGSGGSPDFILVGEAGVPNPADPYDILSDTLVIQDRF